MFLLDQILFPHALNGIIFIILLILTEHNLSKGAPSKYFKQFEFFKSAHIVNVTLILEDEFAFGLDLLVLFDGFSIQVKWIDGMHFLFVLVHVVDGRCVLLQGEIVVVLQGHLLFVEVAIAFNQSFHDFQFKVG